MAIYLTDPGRQRGRPYVGRPEWPFRINQTHPLAARLTRHVVGGVNRVAFDLVTSVQPSLQGTPTVAGWPLGGGSAARCTGGGGLIVPNQPVTSLEYAYRLVFRAVTWPGGFTALVDSSPRSFSLFIDTSGNVSFQNAASTGTVYSSLGMTAGPVWELVVVNNVSAATAATYLNGRYMGPNENTTTAWDAANVYLGYNVSGGGSNADIVVQSFSMWDRLLSAGEVRSLYQNPWDLYELPSRRTFLNIGAASGRIFKLAGYGGGLVGANKGLVG